MKSLKLITVFVLSAIGVVGVEIFEKENIDNYDNYTPMVNVDSLILSAKSINDKLRNKNEIKAYKAKKRLENIKIDSAKKEKIIDVQKKSIEKLEVKNKNLISLNNKLYKEINDIKKKDTLNLVKEKKKGFIKNITNKLFSKNDKK